MSEQAAWALVDDLAATISTIHWSPSAWMYLERVPSTWLSPDEQRDGLRLAHFDPQAAFARWERGRAFDAERELRWERRDDRFHLVHCGAEVPPIFRPAALGAVGRNVVDYYLWGRQVRESDRERIGLQRHELAFIELRIPRIFSYPVSPQAERVRVRVHELIDAEGQLCYARWAGLHEEVGE